MPPELQKRKKKTLKYHSKKHEVFEDIWSLLGLKMEVKGFRPAKISTLDRGVGC